MEYKRSKKGRISVWLSVLLIMTGMMAGTAAAAPSVGETIALYAGTVIRVSPDKSASAVAQLAEPTEVEVTGEPENGMIPVKIGFLEGYVSPSSFADGEEAETAGSYEEGEADCLREDIVQYAVQYIGYPYVYGGSSIETGTDCSGFTQEVYGAFGFQLPRTAEEQAYCGTRRELTEAKTGDLIFYTNGSSIYHVSIYLGDGMTVQAANSIKGIVIEPLYSSACWAVDLIEG